MLVVYDAPLPIIYTDFADEPDAGFAWCWRIGPADAALPTLRLAWSGDDPEPGPAATLPHGLEVLRFLLAGDRTLQWRCDDLDWHWRRDG